MDIVDLFLCPVCKDLSTQEKEELLSKSGYKTKLYKKGDRIANQGDTVNSLYILLKGRVKTEMISGSGTILNIETIQAPSPLAPAFLFAENNRFPVDVIALEACEIILIPKSFVMQELASNEAFLQNYMAYNANRTTFLSERLKLLSVKTIKGKLAQYILSRSEGCLFSMGMNQTELAEYFGVARPSLARSLSEMIDNQIIQINKRKGEILNLNALKELIVQ